MQNLKKALGKDEFRKQTKKNVTASFKKEVKWTDVEDLIECRSIYKKTCEITAQNNLMSVIIEGFESGQLKNFPELLNSLIEKYQELHGANGLGKSLILEKICSEIEEMIPEEKSAMIKKYLEITLQKIQKWLLEARKKQRQIHLREYEALANILNPQIKRKEKINIEKKIEQKPSHTLGTSVSTNNLRIKFTQEEYEFKNSISNKKSQGNLKHRASSIDFQPKDYKNILETLLKQPNTKLVKSKIEYDFSAILQASKSNIHKRNKTNVDLNKKKNNQQRKINQLKKDEAFIFYRPKK